MVIRFVQVGYWTRGPVGPRTRTAEPDHADRWDHPLVPSSAGAGGTVSVGRQASPSGPSLRPAALHLLWTMPMALGAAAVLTVVAGIAACGVSGCSGAGFGPTEGRRLLVAGLVAVAGAVLATPLVAVVWVRRRSVRLGVAVTLAVVWAAWGWLTATGTA